MRKLADLLDLPVNATNAPHDFNQTEIMSAFVSVDCKPLADSPAKISCKDVELTVYWSTDLTFEESVTYIPSPLRKTLTNRLVTLSQHPILDLVLINTNPPYVSFFASLHT